MSVLQRCGKCLRDVQVRRDGTYANHCARRSAVHLGYRGYIDTDEKCDGSGESAEEVRATDLRILADHIDRNLAQTLEQHKLLEGLEKESRRPPKSVGSAVSSMRELTLALARALNELRKEISEHELSKEASDASAEKKPGRRKR